MYSKKSLDNILRQIIARKRFVFNTKTGYYCIDNYDKTFLFEYHPLSMDIITSNVVKKYIEHCNYSTYKIEAQITKFMSDFYNRRFRKTIFAAESFSEVIKFNRFYDLVTKKPHKNILNLPLDFYDFSCIELNCSKVYYKEDLSRGLSMNKQIIIDYKNIDISDLPSGSYNLSVYVPNFYNGRKLSIKIIND